MSLRDLCKPHPSVDRNATLKEAMALFSGGNTDFLVVLDGAKPIGTISSFDVLEKIAEGAEPEKIDVKEVMTPALLVLDAALSPEETAEIMIAHKHWMAVVTENGKYKGVVTATNLLSHSI